MNEVFLLGNLGNDAELRVTAGGKSVLKFSLATSEKWTDAKGEKQEKTQWHRCVFWNDRGEKLAQYLTKGTKLVVRGSIDYGSYDKDGTKVYTTDIKVRNVEFAGGKNSDGPRAPAPSGGDDFEPGLADADLPF